MEGFQSPFRRLAPSTTGGPSVAKESQRAIAGRDFNAYKRPTPIRQPRGEVDTLSPSTLTASAYLRQKYGDFSGAVEVAPPPPVVQQTQIMGVDAITAGDLKLIQNAIDNELIRLQALRIVSEIVDLRKSQLTVLSENVADVLGRVDRGEITVEEVTIFPATARQFMKTFRSAQTLPELFDPEGRSPKSVGAVKSITAPSAAPVAAPTVAPSAAAPGASKGDFMAWLHDNIQSLKWYLEMDYDVEEVKQKEMRDTLDTMEQRVLGYSYTDTPMPASYQELFVQKIREIRNELKGNPE